MGGVITCCNRSSPAPLGCTMSRNCAWRGVTVTISFVVCCPVGGIGAPPNRVCGGTGCGLCCSGGCMILTCCLGGLIISVVVPGVSVRVLPVLMTPSRLVC